MHVTFEPNQSQAEDPLSSSRVFLLDDDGVQTARVTPAQQLLFPSSPRSVCDELGIQWQAAVCLQEEGWLSFALESTPQLDEAQEAELRFVGTLFLAGCDRDTLRLLLARLPRPYAYDLKRLYFDWSARRWRLLPDPGLNPEATFTEWLDLLVQSRDVASLTGIAELAQDAVSRVKRYC